MTGFSVYSIKTPKIADIAAVFLDRQPSRQSQDKVLLAFVSRLQGSLQVIRHNTSSKSAEILGNTRDEVSKVT